MVLPPIIDDGIDEQWECRARWPRSWAVRDRAARRRKIAHVAAAAEHGVRGLVRGVVRADAFALGEREDVRVRGLLLDGRKRVDAFEEAVHLVVLFSLLGVRQHQVGLLDGVDHGARVMLVEKAVKRGRVFSICRFRAEICLADLVLARVGLHV